VLESSVPISDIPSSPLLVLYPPSISTERNSAESLRLPLNSDDEMDMANGMRVARGLALDIPISSSRSLFTSRV
jgi:hypothetical protein